MGGIRRQLRQLHHHEGQFLKSVRDEEVVVFSPASSFRVQRMMPSVVARWYSLGWRAYSRRALWRSEYVRDHAPLRTYMEAMT
jgi:hypothetical protein